MELTAASSPALAFSLLAHDGFGRDVGNRPWQTSVNTPGSAARFRSDKSIGNGWIIEQGGRQWDQEHQSAEILPQLHTYKSLDCSDILPPGLHCLQHAGCPNELFMPKKGGNRYKSDAQDAMFGLGGTRLLHGAHLLSYTAPIAWGRKTAASHGHSIICRCLRRKLAVIHQ